LAPATVLTLYVVFYVFLIIKNSFSFYFFNYFVSILYVYFSWVLPAIEIK